MPIKAELTPIPSHEGFDGFREQIDAGKQEATDRGLLKYLSEQQIVWRKNLALFHDGADYPIAKLNNEQKKTLRGLKAAELAPADIEALLLWIGESMKLLAAQVKR